ncbi:MAG TPA: ATP-binding protein, partial [Polyangium sp.]|nr:ATP-binding protein [Polyangium sp.]
MARFFNTTGNCRPEWHYMVPAVPRLPEAAGLIEQMNYFVVHAPRQTGKTTTLIALAKELTASGKFAAVHFSCEQARVYPEDVRTAEYVILKSMAGDAAHDLPKELCPPPIDMTGEGSWLMSNLAAWARQCPRPLVLFFDEIDSLSGASLLSVLSQLRAGFKVRPREFPVSIILCGLRDVRDYKMASG